MRRREFIGLLSGVATWPVGVRAQQADRVRVVGVIPLGPSYGKTETAGELVLKGLHLSIATFNVNAVG